MRVFAICAGLVFFAAALPAQAQGPFDPPGGQAEPAAELAGGPVELGAAPTAAPPAPEAQIAAPAPAPAAQAVTAPPASPAPVAAVQTASDQISQARFGYAACLDVYQGLPSADEGPRRVILFGCHGRDNQRVALYHGGLFIGGDYTHVIEPAAAPMQGCAMDETESHLRRYQLGQCREDGAASQRVADYSGGRARILSVAERGVSGASIGAPVIARRLRKGERPLAQWEFITQTRQLRLIGTELCLTPPSQDFTNGAPLYLDNCAAPFQLDGARRADGVRRTRVIFEHYWGGA